LIGVIGLLCVVFWSAAALIGYSYFRMRKLVQFGLLALGRVVAVSVGGRINSVSVEFNFDGRTVATAVGVEMKEALNTKVGDSFLIIFDPEEPVRAERFPHPFWHTH
jgi:hypothetical protein